MKPIGTAELEELERLAKVHAGVYVGRDSGDYPELRREVGADWEPATDADWSGVTTLANAVPRLIERLRAAEGLLRDAVRAMWIAEANCGCSSREMETGGHRDRCYGKDCESALSHIRAFLSATEEKP